MAAPAKLNRDLILDEAIAILREEGLEEVTLRKLAARLGVEAPSLYRHISSKQELLALVTLRMFKAQLDQVGERMSWQEWLLEFGRVLWSTQTRIRDSARLVLTTDFTPEQLVTMSDWATDALARYGIPYRTAREMHFSVQAIELGLSGLAEGPNGAFARTFVPFDEILDNSLRALVAGWEARLAGKELEQKVPPPLQ